LYPTSGINGSKEGYEMIAIEHSRVTGRTVIFNNETTPYTNRLYNGLSDRSHDIVVLSCTEQQPNRLWAQTIRAKYVRRTLRGFTFRLSESRFAFVNFGIFRSLKELQPSRLIIYGIFPSMLAAAIWACANKVPFALSTDGWARTMPTTLCHRLARSFVLKRCFAVACCGIKGAAFMRGQGVSDERIFIVPLIPAWEVPTHLSGFADRQFDLLWCAHMNDTVKNVSFFVDVALLLKARFPNLKIRLVGQGKMQVDALRRLTLAGISHRHDAYVEWSEMADVYSSAKVLVFPSLWEPWGLVCNEAMLCGTPPIISPFVGAAEDLVIPGKNGIVEPLEVSKWVNIITSILHDQKEWEKLSKSAYQDSAARTIEQSLDAFERFLRRGI
jgi:glycosyltransferase involved in cell wall biosynthesis